MSYPDYSLDYLHLNQQMYYEYVEYQKYMSWKNDLVIEHFVKKKKNYYLK
jgi:hypothetical protein